MHLLQQWLMSMNGFLKTDNHKQQLILQIQINNEIETENISAFILCKHSSENSSNVQAGTDIRAILASVNIGLCI